MTFGIVIVMHQKVFFKIKIIEKKKIVISNLSDKCNSINQKKDKLENMKKLFGYTDIVDGKLYFKSFRETSPQELEKNGKLNIRLLNEFQFVISNIQNKELAFEIMKKHLYNRTDENERPS